MIQRSFAHRGLTPPQEHRGKQSQSCPQGALRLTGEELAWNGKGEIRNRWGRRHSIHSVNYHSLSTYYVPGVILGAGVTAVDKTARMFCEALISVGKAKDR